jgi:hypothetical protein
MGFLQQRPMQYSGLINNSYRQIFYVSLLDYRGWKRGYGLLWLKNSRTYTLLDVKNMQRESCESVQCLRWAKTWSTHCDQLHYCVGTVHRAWNCALARSILYNGIGAFVFSNSSTYRNCDAKLCNGFVIDRRYICSVTSILIIFMNLYWTTSHSLRTWLGFQSRKDMFWRRFLKSGSCPNPACWAIQCIWIV